MRDSYALFRSADYAGKRKRMKALRDWDIGGLRGLWIDYCVMGVGIGLVVGMIP